MKNNDLNIASFASKNNENAYKRYVAKKKAMAALKMIVVIVVSLIIGFMIGKNYVIMNQCITTDDMQQGEYISILDDDVNVYWYE